MWWRLKRQLTVVFTILLIIGALGYGAYKKYIPAPTCFDNRQNQRELGVDCGGPCIPCALLNIQDIQIGDPLFLQTREGSYDALAFIKNPNTYYRSARVDYEFDLLDQSQAPIAIQTGSTFINQNESLTIVEPDIRTSIKTVSASFRITKVLWEKNFTEPMQYDVALTERKYSVENTAFGGKQSVVRTGVFNNTGKLFSRVYVSIFLLDQNKNIVGANKTIIENLGPGETRPITFTWPNAIGARVDSMRGEARINSFAE